MTRVLLPSSGFLRASQRLLRKKLWAAQDLHATLQLLAEDAFHPQLRTHKLRGKLAGSWACSVDYDVRVVFDFINRGDAEAILLITVGTHEEVY
ncbi:MAG: type II toxin-antitoxin system mRNA interferase toxin, RelE/StbE family [Deltaproteobacteria bacterium]|nr:MAG: type II toxin-antitoxin system mRNA interferase toxin, RelE/StbE family [Deltaproteobacteria bacterium]